MKFQCSACGLRLNALHFKQAGLINPKLTSICDLCQQRGLKAEDYANPPVAIFAQTLLYAFCGQKKAPLHQAPYLLKDKHLRRRYEAFLDDYDGNEVAQQQVKRSILNQALVASETGQLKYIPDPDQDFAFNLRHLGLKVKFQLNEVDFVEREVIRARYHYRCQYCGRRGSSVDHKNPVSLSQNNQASNLTLACAECNRIKSNMPFKLFKHLNDQIPMINKQLVKYEATLGTLREEFSRRRRKLAAQVHLKGVVNDPELAAIRRQNKKLQDAIDSLASDYANLRKTRATYFETGWKLAKAEKQPNLL